MATLDAKQLALIKESLYKYCGIYLSDTKLTMIKNRIYSLMRETHMLNINELLLSIENNNNIQQNSLIASQQTKLTFSANIHISKI